MKILMTKLQTAVAWIKAHVDAGDALGLVGLAIAYDGARELFGSGWARFGLGGLIILVYVLREISVLARSRNPRGGNR